MQEPENHKDKSEAGDKLADIQTLDAKPTRAALKQQPAGILTEDVTYKKETKPVTWALADMEEDQQQKLSDKLEKIAKQNNDPKVLQKSLIYLLGSLYYKKAINKAEAFEADFDEPYLPDPAKADKDNKNEQSEKAIILLDASSSMLLEVDGKQKMKVAKKAVKRFANTIGQKSGNEVSLVVYGHKGSESDADKKKSCHGIEEIYPMNPYDKKQFNQSLGKFKSKGWTPLAGAIQKANKMSQSYQGKITVYIVSDGKETCGGKPVKAAKAFTKKDDKKTVNIIGFNVDESSENQLSKVADAGDGEYFAADDPDELNATFEDKLLPSAGELAWAHMKGPNGWDITAQDQRLDKRLAKIRAIIRREDDRYQTAIQIMKKEEWVSDDTADKVEQMRHDRYDELQDMVKTFKEEKYDDIKEDADQIDNQVQDWVKKMRKLKKQQGD